MNKMLVGAIVVLATYFVLTPFLAAQLGVANTMIFTVLAIMLVVGALGYLNVIKVLNKKTSMWVAVLGIVGMFFIGAFSGLISGIGIPAASVGGTSILPAAAPSAAATVGCAAANPDIQGKAAGLILNAYDMEADSPYATTVDTSVYLYKADSVSSARPTNFISQQIDTTAGAVASSSSGLTVGNKITLVGINSTNGTTYYVDAVEGACIDGEQKAITVNVHTIAGIADYLSTTIYDDTASSALSSGSTGCDYTQAMGASETKVNYIKLKVNKANVAYYLHGFAVATLTNMDTVNPSGSDAALFTQIATPRYLKDQTVGMSTSCKLAGCNNETKTYTVYKLNTPVMLHEFESVKYQITVKSSSTDPGGTCNTSTATGYALVWLDGGATVADTGIVYNHAISNMTAGEENIYFNENVTSPAGLREGALVAVS